MQFINFEPHSLDLNQYLCFQKALPVFRFLVCYLKKLPTNLTLLWISCFFGIDYLYWLRHLVYPKKLFSDSCSTQFIAIVILSYKLLFSLSRTRAFNAICGRTSKLMFLLSLPGSLNTQIGELDGTCGKIFATFISWTSSGLIAWTIFFWTLFQKSTCVLWYLYIKLFKKLFNFIYILFISSLDVTLDKFTV